MDSIFKITEKTDEICVVMQSENTLICCFEIGLCSWHYYNLLQ